MLTALMIFAALSADCTAESKVAKDKGTIAMRYRDHAPLPDGLPTGPLNRITDVPGLAVGHHTLIEDSPRVLRTGVSVLRIDDALNRPVAAACHVFNGYGKSMGLVQIEELGSIESSIYLTNTLSIGAVQQGAVALVREANPHLRSHNAVVMECNDGTLSQIATLAVTPEMAGLAMADAREDFALGSVGAGTGMICFGFKGGIGSASRRIAVDGREFTVGALVLANFGRREDLRMPGLETALSTSGESGDGSLIMIIATDLPLLPHQLKRVARHAGNGMGLLGCPGSNGSGDISIAFSTTTRGGGADTFQQREVIVNDSATMSLAFRAAAWATAEAILDAMVASPAMKSHHGDVPALGEVLAKARTD